MEFHLTQTVWEQNFLTVSGHCPDLKIAAWGGKGLRCSCCLISGCPWMISAHIWVCLRACWLTFAGSDVVQVQLVALLGSLQGALGGKELARGVIGLVVGAANLKEGKRRRTSKFWLKWGISRTQCFVFTSFSPQHLSKNNAWKKDFTIFLPHFCLNVQTF